MLLFPVVQPEQRFEIGDVARLYEHIQRAGGVGTVFCTFDNGQQTFLDLVGNGRAFAGLGISPEPFETIVPSYLYRYRKAGQFSSQSL